jgi:hypothetical protein
MSGLSDWICWNLSKTSSSIHLDAKSFPDASLKAGLLDISCFDLAHMSLLTHKPIW